LERLPPRGAGPIVLVSFRFFHEEARKKINFDQRLLAFRWDSTWMQKAVRKKPIKWVKAHTRKQQQKKTFYIGGD